MQKRFLRQTYRLVAVSAIGLAVMWWSGAFAPAAASDEELRLLNLVLHKFTPKTGFIVVSPQSKLSEGLKEPGTAAWLKKAFEGRLRRKDPVVDLLVDKLIARNRQPVPLPLEPDKKARYVLDDGSYAKYLAEQGGGWEKLYADHPKVRNITEVSLPAYDPDSGMALVYLGKNWGPREGGGGLILFRYAATRMVVVSTISLWAL